MSEPMVIGVQPWLPKALAERRWWTEPVRAERLAIFRIGIALVLLVDVLGSYWPRLDDLFGPNSLGSAGVFSSPETNTPWPWSMLIGLENPTVIHWGAIAWVVAAFCLLIGFFSRTSAAVAWVLSNASLALNPYIAYTGDTVRTVGLFYLLLCPCNTVWSVDAWLERKRGRGGGTAWIHPWPLRLLFIQLVMLYFYNGLHKFVGPIWRQGDSLYYILNDLSMTRWSSAQIPVPYWATKLSTWLVMAWELSFPLLVLSSRTRNIALAMGVAFHLGIALSLEVCLFSPYMWCLYLPLLPWEKVGDRLRSIFGLLSAPAA